MKPFPDRSRRHLLERMRYVLGEKRWRQFVAMIESGEWTRQRRLFMEQLERDELDQHFRAFELKRNFPGYFN